MVNGIGKRVRGIVVSRMKEYIEEKCNIKVPSVKFDAIISDSENFTIMAEKLGNMLRGDGMPEEVAEELVDKFPELVKLSTVAVKYIDSQFSILQTSINAIQEQMHIDKIKDVESILILIEKNKEEKNITEDEWKSIRKDLQVSLGELTGEITHNIDICNMAPREIDNINGILSTLKIFLKRNTGSKQIETSLKIIEEALKFYEAGIEELFSVELYYLNRMENAKTTLNSAMKFISENFLNGGDENNSNIMEWLTDEKKWTEEPKDFYDKLNGVIHKLEETVI